MNVVLTAARTARDVDFAQAWEATAKSGLSGPTRDVELEEYRASPKTSRPAHRYASRAEWGRAR